MMIIYIVILISILIYIIAGINCLLDEKIIKAIIIIFSFLLLININLIHYTEPYLPTMFNTNPEWHALCLFSILEAAIFLDPIILYLIIKDIIEDIRINQIKKER